MNNADPVLPDRLEDLNHSDAVRQLLRLNSRVFRPKEIAAALPGVPRAYVGPLLKRLSDHGEIRKVGYGQYRAAEVTSDDTARDDRAAAATSAPRELTGKIRPLILTLPDGRVLVARDVQQVVV